jgi:hypothetical protein
MSSKCLDVLPDEFGFRFNEFSPDSYLCRQGYPRLLEDLASGKQTECNSDLHAVLCILAAAHLGLPCALPLEEVASVGCDAALQYFRGAWRQHRPDESAKLDKQPDNPRFEWFRGLSRGWLVALLVKRDDALLELANWVESWMRPVVSTEECDPLYAKFYLLMASEFRQ